MSFGAGGSDTLSDEEQIALRAAVETSLPAYRCTLHANEDLVAWAVLEPPRSAQPLPRFTVCRVDPCILVMVEDRADTRRFCSMPSVEDAIGFARQTAAQAVLALGHIHAEPGTAQ